MATRSPRPTPKRVSSDARPATLRRASWEDMPWYRPSLLDRKQSGLECLATACRNSSLRVLISLEPMPLENLSLHFECPNSSYQNQVSGSSGYRALSQFELLAAC